MLNLIKRSWNSKAVGVSAAVVLVLALGAVILAIVLSFTAPVKPNPAAPQPGEAAPIQTTAPTADTGACNVPAGDTSLRPKLPADLRWAAAQGLTWPVSATVGPTKSKDGFPVCFARSPLGAALMGTSFINSIWQGQPARSVVDFYVADGPGKQILLSKSTGSGDPKKIASDGITPAGFLVDAFTPDEAHVTVVATAPGTQSGYAGFPLTMIWSNGDWRIKVLDTGDGWAGSLSSPVKGQFVEWRQ